MLRAARIPLRRALSTARPEPAVADSLTGKSASRKICHGAKSVAAQLISARKQSALVASLTPTTISSGDAGSPVARRRLLTSRWHTHTHSETTRKFWQDRVVPQHAEWEAGSSTPRIAKNVGLCHSPQACDKSGIAKKKIPPQSFPSSHLHPHMKIHYSWSSQPRNLARSW